MKNFNPKMGEIHFIGIGGIGMSGIAEVLHTLGFEVRGSDLSDNNNVKRLREKGIKIKLEHSAKNIDDASVVVISSAVKNNNIEIEAAKNRRIPVVKRAEMLAELMRLKNTIAIGGTHGKTTTTSLIAAILEKADMDPTVINGGIINSLASNAKLGRGNWMVVEADESDGSFLKLPSTIAIITNIDPAHLDYYGSYTSLRKSFKRFVNNIPFYGFAVVCIDNPAIQTLISEITDRRIITYGLSPQADVRGINLETNSSGTKFNLEISPRIENPTKVIEGLCSTIPGVHNVQNALAACTTALELGVEVKDIKLALNDFEGVRRRFTVTDTNKGIKVIDDYGHHPMEIKSVISTAREITTGKVIVIVQPHRYSRVKDLFKDFTTAFNDADILFVSDIYSAGEEALPNINKESLIRALNSSGHKDVRPMNNIDTLFKFLFKNAVSGDSIIFLGAGDITNWANQLVEEISKENFE